MALNDMLRAELERVISNNENSAFTNLTKDSETHLPAPPPSPPSPPPPLPPADLLNLADSNEFVFNSNEQKLHVRSYWPNDATDVPPTAAIIFLHGYNSHSCRPVHTFMAEGFVKQKGCVYITLDFHGHGRSEGLKGFIGNFVDLVDDVVSVLSALYAGPNETSYFRIKKPLSNNIPFYLMGHSMGGTVALLTSTFLNLQNLEPDDFKASSKLWKHVCSMYRGCILLCPAIVVPTPPPLVLWAMDYLAAPLFPTASIPTAFSSNADDSHLVWTDPLYIKYIASDKFPQNPNGLSWGEPMRLMTASAIMAAITKARASLSEVNCPVLVFHDPSDKITLQEGSDMVMRLTSTHREHKKLIPVHNGKHDLIANCLDMVVENTAAWILAERSHWAPDGSCGQAFSMPHDPSSSNSALKEMQMERSGGDED